MTKVISGFPAVGKSYLFENNPDLIILDSDSSNFSWISEGVRNPEFPDNYMQHIRVNLGNASTILVSSHKVVRDALKENNIPYTLIYPDKSLKEEYILRYQARGNNENFINMIDANWDDFIDEIEEEVFPKKIKLQANQYLKDIFVREPYSVCCSDICTSQFDDYCGMHMSNEECPVCTHTWNEAHLDNEVYQNNTIE